MLAVRVARGGLHLLVGGVKAPKADVLADATLEEPRVLKDHREALPQVLSSHVAHVVAVHAERAPVHVVEAKQELHERCLAGAGGTHDGHRAARLDVCREVMDDCLPRQVAKRDVVEVHGTGGVANRLGRRARGGVKLRGLFLLRCLQELKDALSAGGHLLQHVGHRCQLRDGLREVLDVLDEGLDVARLDGARHGKASANHNHAHVTHVAHKVHERLHEAREKLALPRTLKELVVLLLKALHGTLAAVERLDHHLPREVLLNAPVHGTKLLLL